MIAIVALLLAGSDQAATPVQPVPAAAKPKMHCEYEEVMGSRLGGRKICMTQEEYLQRRHEAQDNLDRRQTAIHQEKSG